MATHNHDSRSSSGFPSPVLMRRRLSAPETIMRKHTLSQQRSDSTESDSTQLSSISPARLNKATSFWNRSSTTGSESNLSRKQYKRDPDLMRKSTLLRRMWSREFTGSISRLYNEEIFPKKTSLSMKSQSRSPVRSIRSSPEHGVNKERGIIGSPERLRRLNDVSGLKSKWDPDNNMNSYSSYTSDAVTRSRVSSTSESNKSMLETSSTDIKVSSISTSTSEKESYTTNTSTRTRSTTASNSSGANLDDNSNNSDSAYTNSTQTYSTFSSPKSNPENNNNMDCGTPKQTLNANFNNGERGQSDNGHTQTPSDLNSNTNKSNASDYKWSNNQTEVDQTTPKIDEHTAELNIVNLSAATLNIIINNSPELNNKVQDLITGQQKQQQQQISGDGDNSLAEFVPQVPQNPEAKLVKVDNVKKPESFYLKRKENVPITAEHNRLIKYMISNVGTGSPYSKPTEAPQLVVPRYSALPRSISMEVNTSSADSTDKESDTASLVDSLDDPNSPRQSALTPRIKYDDKPVRGDLSALLPDNSSSCKDTPRTKLQKSQAFYVPIVQDEAAENVKTVAEHLPERVRNKLSKRQQVMEQKKLSAKKSDQLDTNGNQPDSLVETEPISEGTWTNNGTLKKVKKEKKLKNPLQSLQSYKVNSRGELMMNPTVPATKTKRSMKQTKRKPSKLSESSESSTNIALPRQSLWNHHAQLKAAANATTTPVENKVEIIESPPKKPEAKPIFNNRIEILEIMECVEQETENKSIPNNQTMKNGNRSKIPVPVQKSIESPNRQVQIQSIFQAYDITQVPETSPKTDQLIANILIDALNKSDIDEINQQEVTKIVSNQLNEKRPPPIAAKIQANRYQQKFDMIPEEKEKLSSLGSSDESNLSKETKQNPKTESKEVEVQTQNECKTPVPAIEKKCLADASSQTDLQAAELPPRIPNAYKGKAALAMMKDEDFSTIPKGWITFYMLRKSPGSPDSSTDEGNNVADGKSNNNIDDKTDSLELRQLRPVLIRKRIGKENLSELHLQETHIAQDYNSNKISNPIRDEDAKRALSLEHLNETFTVIKKEHYTSSSESSNTQSPNNELDIEQKSACPSLPIALPARPGRRQSHRRGRYKTTQSQGTNATQTPGGWSVTVSGTNSCGQPAPDLEMRLKFPCPQPTSQSDSGLGEEHPRQPKRNFENANGEHGDFHLPPAKPVQTKKFTVITRKHASDLPDDSLNSRSFQYLPDLIKNKHQRTKVCDVFPVEHLFTF